MPEYSTIDLDAARAARQEVAPDAVTPKLNFKGQEFDLPLELPFGVFLRMGGIARKQQRGEHVDPMESLAAMDSLIRALFGDKADEFLDLSPSMQDILQMIEALMGAYDVDLGKAPASQSSSSSTTEQ